MPAERKISSESVTGLFTGTRVLMSPVPRKEEETNHSFQLELDSAQEVLLARERRHTQLVAVFLTLVVLASMMVLYMSPINESGGKMSVAQLSLVVGSLSLMAGTSVWLCWRLCCRSSSFSYLKFSNAAEEV